MFRSNYNLYPPCRKHPRHRQSPGVCSICLNEKLSNVSSATSSTTNRSRFPPPSSSSSSSSSVSSCASPHHHSKARVSNYTFSGSLLSKSKSVAAVRRPFDRRTGEEHDDHKGDDHKGSDHKEKKKKRGFWSKLFSSQPREAKRISNDHHLHHVVDQGYMYSQPLTRDTGRIINRRAR